jgi:hypothetical protein
VSAMPATRPVDVQPATGTGPSIPEMDVITLDTLALLACWVAWQTQVRKPGDKKTKLPYAPLGPDSKKARANDPTTWGARAQAEARAARLPKPCGTGGIGLEFMPLPDGRNVGGVDLDTCRNADSGQLEPWAQAVVDRFATYTEVSPSGSGVKLFFTYDPGGMEMLQTAMGRTVEGKLRHGREWSRKTGADHPPAIELHLSNRFFAVTGQRLDGCTGELRLVPTADILALIQIDGPALAAGGERDEQADAAMAAPTSAHRAKRDGSTKADRSRSAAAFRKGTEVRCSGGTFEQMCDALRNDPEMAGWYLEKGMADGGRELRRIWSKVTPRRAWVQECQTDRDGAPRANLSNVMLALRAEPELHGLVAMDLMMRAPLLLRPVPSKAMPASHDEFPRFVRDTDVTALQEWLQIAGLETISKDTCHQAIDLLAQEQAFHPARNYFERAAVGRHTAAGDLAGHISPGAPDRVHTRHRHDVSDQHGRTRRRSRMQGGLHAGPRRRAGTPEIHGMRHSRWSVVLGFAARSAKRGKGFVTALERQVAR